MLPAVSRRLRAALAALPCVAFGATLLMKIGGGDIFWHLRTGQWIAAHRALPATDPFAYTSAGPWRYQDVLAELLYAGVDALGGPAALVILHALIGVALAALVMALAEGRIGSRALAMGLFGAASHAAMAAKPQVFSYLAFASLLLWLRAAERSERPLRVLAPLPLLFLLWGNLHRGGTLGLAVLGAALVAWLLRADQRRHAAGLLLVLAGSTLALTLNPGGLFYLTSAFDLATRSSFSALLVDWQPLSADLLVSQHLALVPLLALAFVEAVRRVRDDRGRAFDAELLVALGTAVLAFRSVRFVPFFAIALVPAASRAVDASITWLEKRAKEGLRPGLLSASALALGLAALSWRYTQKVPPAYWGAGVVEARVPVALSAFLRESPPPGHMFNAFDLGGYLLYALAPEQQVFIDGRNDTVYDDAFFRRALFADRSPADFARAIEGLDVGYAVVPWSGPSDPRFAFLHADPRWVLVYWDDAGVVLVRRSAASAAYLAEHGYRELSLHDAFVRAANLGDTERDRVLAAEIRRQRERAPDSLSTLYLAALLHRRLGERDAYARAASELMRIAAERGVFITPP